MLAKDKEVLERAVVDIVSDLHHKTVDIVRDTLIYGHDDNRVYGQCREVMTQATIDLLRVINQEKSKSYREGRDLDRVS